MKNVLPQRDPRWSKPHRVSEMAHKLLVVLETIRRWMRYNIERIDEGYRLTPHQSGGFAELGEQGFRKSVCGANCTVCTSFFFFFLTAWLQLIVLFSKQRIVHPPGVRVEIPKERPVCTS